MALVMVACLACPMPVLAAPAPLPDWGVKGKPADKPADKPAGTTAPLPDWGVAGKPGKPKAKPGKVKKSKPSTKPGEPEPTEPTEPDAAAEPDTAAEPTGEPTPGEPTTAGPAPVATEASTATPSPEPAESVEPKPAVDAQAAQQLTRRGRNELITGAVFMAGGLAGFGVLGAGLFLKNKAEDELAEGEGRTDVSLEPLREQQQQGATMIAAGAVAGALGMALGIALVAAGAWDRKNGRAGRLQSRVRVAPTFGGLVISGRF